LAKDLEDAESAAATKRRLDAAAARAATGVACSVGAYALWGVFPIYFKAVATVPALEVLAHRIVWSVVLVAGLLSLQRGWPRLVRVFADRRLLLTLTASACVISVNWGVFIWAVADGRILECSLGYYINPLVSVVLGVAVLRERLRRLQWLAVAIAAIGVAIEVVSFGTLPWVALTLALSFAFYGLIRKTAPVDPVSGLFIETLLLSPAALIFLAMLAAQGAGAFLGQGLRIDVLLLLAGPITALPLLLFVAGAQRIRLTTVGLLQYIAPTGHFLLAVFVYHEPFTPVHLATFSCIWLALAIYSLSILHGRAQA
jgi:chloramphenicol-sensitive protein RarD